MARVLTIRVWASIGVLVLAAGLPYCSAALSWAATQDDNNIYVREDIAMGIVVSWIGWTILAIALTVWCWKRLRRRTSAASLNGQARARSRASASRP